MTPQTETCQNCKQVFEITSDDEAFYKKIDVPAPTWCPECRLRRRQAFRSERALYKRECGLCHKIIITGYPPEMLTPVYCEKCWWSDRWGGEDFAMEYNTNVSFWDQLKELRAKTPRLSLNTSRNDNCPYANYTWLSKNCYLTGSTLHSESVMYSGNVDRSSFCLDSIAIGDSQFCYENVESEKNYKSTFLFRSQSCIDSHFLVDCRNCKDCFMSSNLRNKEYIFQNKQLTKTEYKNLIAQYRLEKYSVQDELRKKFESIKKASVWKFTNLIKTTDSIGDNIVASKNIYRSFDVRDSENIRYSARVLITKDSMDINNVGPGCELFYECMNAGLNDGRYKFCVDCWDGCFDIEYCDLCMGCQNTFGCVGLKKKRYYILNKQYTKEEYESLIPKIVESMSVVPYIDSEKREYRYGEFFPMKFSPYPHNTSLSQEHFPMSKNETIEKGYFWKDQETRNYVISLDTIDIPDNIKDVSDSILKEVIGCAHVGKCNEQCTTAFKIVEEELAFYRRMNLPLPRLCPNCRHYERLKQRNPLKLWHRKCQCVGKTSENGVYANPSRHQHGDSPCPNEFETSYSPDRPEIVYCEQCYQAEVI